MHKTLATKLKALREKSSYSLQDIADLVGVAKQSIHKFENGLVKPSSENLVKLAQVFNIPYSSFYESSEENLSFRFQDIKFREKHKISNHLLEEEIREEVCIYLAKIIELQSIIGEVQKFENPLEGLKIDTEKDVEKAAKIVRKKWKMGNAPISDVVETLENQGVYVVEVRRVEDFTGLSGFANDKIPVIVLNENCLNVERKRFTALHELGHIILEFIENLPEKRVETLCNAFAGAILLVDDIIYNELGKNRTTISLAELKRIKELYGISIQAIIMRAKDSNFIDYRTFQDWWTSYKEWTSNTNNADFGSFYSNEKAVKFEKLLVKGVTEKRISFSKAAELSGKKIDILRQEFNQPYFNVK